MIMTNNQAVLLPQTEALIHFARSNILKVIGFVEESAVELENAQNLAFECGYKAYPNGSWRDEKDCILPQELLIFHTQGVEDKAMEMDAEEQSLQYFLEEEEKSRAINERYPSNPEGHVLYCCRGHEQFHTTAGWMECGTCGMVMTPGDEERYYDSLVAAGQCL
jgi:hypothetical protein